MDKLQAMNVFVRVVETGGFTRAADALRLPKATVTTSIQQLEAHLRVKLLNRTTRRVTVTSDGAAYYERCLRILNDIAETEALLGDSRTAARGRLRVDVGTAMGRLMVVPALPSFFERYPEIELELGCSDRPVDLVEEGVDCVVRGGDLGDSTLVARRIGELRFITCATPGYLDRWGRPQHPLDLLHHRCVSFFSTKTGKSYEWDFRRGDERHVLAVPGNLSTNDTNAYLQAGFEGLGIVQLTEFVAADEFRSGRLEPILQNWQSDPLPIHAMYPQSRHLSTKVRAFVEWIAELFEEKTHSAGLAAGRSIAPAGESVGANESARASEPSQAAA